MKKRNLFMLVLAFCTLMSYAIPAYKGAITVKQPDGTEIIVFKHGDEFGHYITDVNGNLLEKSSDGFYQLKTHDEAENNLLIQQKQRARLASARKETQYRTTTNFAEKAVVILVNFADKSFVTNDPQEAFTNMLNQEGYSANGGTGSAKDYFNDASNGRYNPHFDVYGPYTLPQNMAYYGKNDYWDEDVLPAQMILDACQLADADIDFSEYDLDNDGIIDQVFVYYAGHNEAEGADDDTVWPHRWIVYNGNSTGSRVFDGKTLYDYACTSELSGYWGSNMCGIGTFCHEFSHVLGLPDLYDTAYSGHNTLGDWDIMDSGSYNNDGRTPPTYSSYERFYVGWMTPTILNTPANITLDEIQSSNSAYLVSSTGGHNLNSTSPNPSTFYLFENRQNVGWDAYLPGHGMLVTKITYNANKWSQNTVNNTASSMGVDIIEADGKSSAYGDSGDTYPNGSSYTSFIPYADYPITDITESNQVISFSFMGGIINCDELSVLFTGEYCSQANGTNCISVGSTYLSTITPNKGYLLTQSDIRVTMDNMELEAGIGFTYIGTTLTIADVTGDLEIEATAVRDMDAQIDFIETFAKCTANISTEITSNMDSYTDNKGWTGTKIFCNSGELKIGASKSKGTIITPALDLTGTVTLSFDARNYDSGSSTLSLDISNGGMLSMSSVALTGTSKTHTITISDCTVNTKITFSNSQNRFYIDNVNASALTSTGIEENRYNDYNIITSNESIQILNVEKGSNIRLYDIMGRLISTYKINASQDVSFSVVEGYYIVQIEKDGKQTTQKVLVK